MKELALINLNDLQPSDVAKLTRRLAARAVVFDADQNVALLHVTKHGYFKLPGGGIESGENALEALKRECVEEIGCAIEVTGEVGSIREYRRDVDQTSYCYLAKVVGDKGTPAFTDKEKQDGFEVTWLPFDDAIHMASGAETSDEDGLFKQKRDVIFLREAKELLMKQ